MREEAELLKLRRQLVPALAACGLLCPDLDDNEFAGRLRRRLLEIGFELLCTWSIDYRIVVTFQSPNKLPPRTPYIFMAHGSTEALAFLRVAECLFQHQHYRGLVGAEETPRFEP